MKNVNSNIAYDYVRKRILNGQYLPGQALIANVIAAEINVSSTPIRDAFRQLEVDGLVTIQPRLGASVKMMDVKNFSESCELRLALEAHAAGLAARNHAEVDLHEIKMALEEMRRITGELIDGGAARKLIPRLVREDVRFHLGIITATKNELIKKEILRLHLVNRVVSSPPSGTRYIPRANDTDDLTHRREVFKSHQRIYEAIAAGDAAAAKRLMEEHIQDIIDRNVRQLARSNAETMTREMSDEEAMYNA